MQQPNILTELYRIAKQENRLTTHIQYLEEDLESVLLLMGRFEFDRAVERLSSILILLSSFPPSTASLRLEARCLTEFGNIRRDQGYIEEKSGAYSLYGRARTIWMQLGDMHKVARTTWYLGACNEMRRAHKEALKYYQEALDILDTVGGGDILRSHILLRMGTVLTKCKALGKAETIIQDSLILIEKRGTASNFAYTQQKLAIVYLSKGEMDKALKEVADTLKIVSKDDKFRITQTKILMADLLFHIKEVDTALQEASEAESLASEYGFNHQLLALNNILNKHTDEKY